MNRPSLLSGAGMKEGSLRPPDIQRTGDHRQFRAVAVTCPQASGGAAPLSAVSPDSAVLVGPGRLAAALVLFGLPELARAGVPPDDPRVRRRDRFAPDGAGLRTTSSERPGLSVVEARLVFGGPEAAPVPVSSLSTAVRWTTSPGRPSLSVLAGTLDSGGPEAAFRSSGVMTSSAP
ncbi:hypothetical protein JCM33774_73900 [Actinophytocola sp. KF-1]